MDTEIGKRAIKSIAKREGRLEDEIKAEMDKAIEAAYLSREKNGMWNEIFGDRKSSPEEFIIKMAERANRKRATV